MRVLLVGLGRFVGSILRYWMTGLAQSASPRAAFPVGTLVVNVVGCLVIGVLAQLGEAGGFLTPDRRALLVIGFLDGAVDVRRGDWTSDSMRDRQ